MKLLVSRKSSIWQNRSHNIEEKEIFLMSIVREKYKNYRKIDNSNSAGRSLNSRGEMWRANFTETWERLNRDWRSSFDRIMFRIGSGQFSRWFLCSVLCDPELLRDRSPMSMSNTLLSLLSSPDDSVEISNGFMLSGYNRFSLFFHNFLIHFWLFGYFFII